MSTKNVMTERQDIGVPVPLVAVARALAQFNSRQIGAAIEVLIALLDIADGDIDTEDGDEDCCAAGDDRPRAVYGQTGLSGGIGEVDDAEFTYPEWQTLSERAQAKGAYEGRFMTSFLLDVPEDDDEDDASAV